MDALLKSKRFLKKNDDKAKSDDIQLLNKDYLV